jgi:acyl-homoserine lactone acylase PvdQ
MNARARFRAIIACAIALACLIVPRSIPAEKVTLYRDLYGVPHAYADSEAGAAFALGYAQAEDRLEQLLHNVREAEGTLAEAFGEEFVEQDYRRRLEQHRKVCRAKYADVPDEVRRYLEAFQAGIKQYMSEHPVRVPKWAPELAPWQPIAIARAVIFNWPMGAAMSELRRRESRYEFSSNQWAVRPERTAGGAAILCIDPHIGWDGLFRFYEMRTHGGKMHCSGFGPLGTPLIGLGHNRRLGWAFTTGGPDTTDIYVEQINPANPKQYRYDGQWREIRTEKEEIRVRQADGTTRTVTREIEYTHHGPIAVRDAGVAFAVACPYFDQIDLATQMYRMCLAENLEQFNAALEMAQMMEQNCMYADDQGNIQYVSTGRVPIRPKGFDWSKPVPGNTSKTEWQGIHSQKEHVRALNPAAGYMQNCNIAPDMMAVPSPVKAADYPAYLWGYGDRPGTTNSRGKRAVELLKADADLTTAEAAAIVNDTHADRAEEWIKAIAQAAEAYKDDARLKMVLPAVESLKKWDGYMTKESTAATLFRVFQMQMGKNAFSVSELAGKTPDRDQQRALLETLGKAVAFVEKNFGRSDVPWGEVHRVARGGRTVPCAGGDPGTGMTLRAVGSRLVGKQLVGDRGQECTTLVVFPKGGAQSWSATPWGQSDDPKSPHYFDQAERLFSNSLLKPTWFEKESLLAGNVESKKELEFGGK